VSGAPARFNKNEIKDPASAINNIIRRGGGNPGVPSDMTPFFRRDADLSSHVRERIVRSAPAAPAVIGTVAGSPARSFPAGSGIPSPGTPGTIEGRIAPRSNAPDTGREGVVNRGDPSRFAPPPVNSERGDTSRDWRDRVSRPSTPSSPTAPTTQRNTNPDESWRGRVPRREFTPRNETPRDETPRNDSPVAPVNPPRIDRGSDVPRRIIDRIGGARIYGEQPQPRDAAPRHAEPAPQPRDTTSSAPPPPPREHASTPPPSRSNEGGHVKRDH